MLTYIYIPVQDWPVVSLLRPAQKWVQWTLHDWLCLMARLLIFILLQQSSLHILTEERESGWFSGWLTLISLIHSCHIISQDERNEGFQVDECEPALLDAQTWWSHLYVAESALRICHCCQSSDSRFWFSSPWSSSCSGEVTSLRCMFQ